MADTVQHLDKLGNIIAVDDVVAVAHHNMLMIAKVIKLNKKMIKVKEIKPHTKYGSSEYNKYSSEVARLNGNDAVMYILKNT
jgi:hypothetical protein